MKPVVLVLDDLHWADEASVVVWQELSRTVRQSPLLLVAACRLTPPRTEVAVLRRHAAARGAAMVGLEPLPPQPVVELVRHLLSAEAVGPRLVDAVAEARGNPLYIRELIAALARERRLRRDAGAMELPDTAAGVPASLAALISDRLRVVSPGTREVLRAAAMLGVEVSATDLTVVLGRPVTQLWPAVAGPGLAFRHPLIGQVLYDSTPAEARAALHRQAAEALAGAGAAVDRVAEQLLAAVSGPGAAGTVDRWVLDWLAGPGFALSHRSPQVAAELLGRAVEHAAADDPRREELQAALVSVLMATGRREEAVELAEQVLAATHDPARAAEMSYWLGRALYALTRYEQARTVLVEALRAGDEYGVWTARVRAWLSAVIGQGGGGFDQETSAREALAAAERAGDRYAAGIASDVIAMSQYFRGDLAGALEVLERIIAMPGDDPEIADLRLYAMGNRTVTLQMLDRLVEGNKATQAYLAAAERYAAPNRLATSRCQAAEYYYTAGLWDEALAELYAVENSGYPLAPRNQLGLHGVRALVAAHRDDEATATASLEAVDDGHDEAGLAAVRRQLLTLARAVLAERAGQPEQALALLAERDAAATEDWRETLPSLTRLALAAGDTGATRSAAERAAAAAAARATGSWIALPRRTAASAGASTWAWCSRTPPCCWPNAATSPPPAPWPPRRPSSTWRSGPTGISGGPTRGCGRTASAAAGAQRSMPPPAGTPSPRPRARSPAWSRRAWPTPTSPDACSCPAVRSRGTSRASWRSSRRGPGSRSCGPPPRSRCRPSRPIQPPPPRRARGSASGAR